MKTNTSLKLVKKILLITSLLYSHSAWCWSDMGHSIIGAIAEERMDPKTKIFIAEILGIEPLALAANWADSVKDDQRFNHADGLSQAEREKNDNSFSDFHFIEIPTGHTYDSRPVKDSKDSLGAINGAIKILQDPKKAYPRSAKIIALRYLIHIIGDIHQPLHVGNGYDRGGNSCMVMLQNDKNPTNLHSVWDNFLVTEFGKSLKDPSDSNLKSPKFYPDYIKLIKKLRSEKFNQAKPSDVSIPAIKSWVEDMMTTRETSVYPDSGLNLTNVSKNDTYKHRPYCVWYSDRKNNVVAETSAKSTKDIPLDAIPKLSDDYINVNTLIVEDLLIKGGVRLAALLDQVATIASEKPAPEDKEQGILRILQQIFKNVTE